MSQRKNFHREFEVFYDSCRSIGTRLKSPAVFIDGFALWVVLLTDDLPCESSRLYSLALSFLSENGWREILTCLSDSDELLLSEGEDVSTRYTDFKHLWNSQLRDCTILCCVKPLFKDGLQVSTFRILHEIFSFMKRLTLDRQELKDEAIAAFIEFDNGLQTEVAAPELNNIIRKWLKGFSYEDFIPSHGNGVCADSTANLLSKYLTFGPSDDKLSYWLRHHQLDVFPNNFRPNLDRRDFRRVSKTTTVPKNWKKRRTICAEPAVLQFLQHGVERLLVTHFQKYLGRRINLRDQSRNRDLAQEGSIGGRFCTIDLSSASDAVSYALCRSMFKGTTLLDSITCLRCPETALPNKTIHHLKKVSSMGSSLTFPVECLVFAAICEFAIQSQGDDPRISDYSVYGDDIVIEREYYDRTVELLSLYGFTVNSEKSFCESSPWGFFRESCGGEYLNGEDVTPVRLSRRFRGLNLRKTDASCFEGLRELCNNAFAHFNLRLAVLGTIAKTFGWSSLFFDDGTRGFWSPTPSNWKGNGKIYEFTTLADPRWYVGIQSIIYKPLLLVTDIESQECEEIRLYETLKSMAVRKNVPESEPIALTQTRGTRLKRSFLNE